MNQQCEHKSKITHPATRDIWECADCGATQDSMNPQISAMRRCCEHKDEDHIMTAYRRYCTLCGCKTKECFCKAGGGLSMSCPMHGSTRLIAQEEVVPEDLREDFDSALAESKDMSKPQAWRDAMTVVLEYIWRIARIETKFKQDLDFAPDKQHTVADMANIGYAFMREVEKGKEFYNVSPVELYRNALSELAEAKAQHERDQETIADTKEALKQFNHCEDDSLVVIAEVAMTAYRNKEHELTHLREENARLKKPERELLNDALKMAADYLDHRQLPDAAMHVRCLLQGEVTQEDHEWADRIIASREKGE